jgi:hypothetical protein
VPGLFGIHDLYGWALTNGKSRLTMQVVDSQDADTPKHPARASGRLAKGMSPCNVRACHQADDGHHFRRLTTAMEAGHRHDGDADAKWHGHRSLQMIGITPARSEAGIAEAGLVRAGRLSNTSFGFGLLSGSGGVEICTRSGVGWGCQLNQSRNTMNHRRNLLRNAGA